MFARITKGANIRKALRYHERKQEEGIAECLLADNFIKGLGELSPKEVLDRFDQRCTLNERVRSNVLQIFLGFDPGDRVDNGRMQKIARHYMKGLGLDQQPFLVYRHKDSAHPHLHILSVTIRADGSWIDVNQAFCRQSYQLAQKMDKEYGLLAQKVLDEVEKDSLKVDHARRVVHGKSPLKRAISDVLNTVFEHYHYTTLDEYNAVLKLYNVKASRGEASSRLYLHGGLLYQALNEKGEKAGKAMKASSFYLKPTLANLEEKFRVNLVDQEANAQKAREAINWAMAGDAQTWQDLVDSLTRERISVVIQQDKKDGQDVLFFVDHRARCVWSGDQLGEQYTLQSLKQRCLKEESIEQQEGIRHRLLPGF